MMGSLQIFYLFERGRVTLFTHRTITFSLQSAGLCSVD